LAWRPLSSTHPPLSVSPKDHFFPGTLLQSLGGANFAAACRSCCHQNSSTVELVDRHYDGRRAVVGQSERAMLYTHAPHAYVTRRSTDRNAIGPILLFAVDVLHNLYLAAVDNISTKSCRPLHDCRNTLYSIMSTRPAWKLQATAAQTAGVLLSFKLRI